MGASPKSGGALRPGQRSRLACALAAAVLFHAFLAWLPGAPEVAATAPANASPAMSFTTLHAESTVPSEGPAPTTAADQSPDRDTGKRNNHRYFDITEVDAPAMPVPDWALDPEMLTARSVRILRADVWINAHGKPDRCVISSMEPSVPSLEVVIARQLCKTSLTPALRRGVPVASMRHLEIVVASE